MRKSYVRRRRKTTRRSPIASPSRRSSRVSSARTSPVNGSPIEMVKIWSSYQDFMSTARTRRLRNCRSSRSSRQWRSVRLFARCSARVGDVGECHPGNRPVLLDLATGGSTGHVEVGGGAPSFAGWLVGAWASDREAARLHISTPPFMALKRAALIRCGTWQPPMRRAAQCSSRRIRRGRPKPAS